jgi:hypothetical protein
MPGVSSYIDLEAASETPPTLKTAHGESTLVTPWRYSSYISGLPHLPLDVGVVAAW